MTFSTILLNAFFVKTGQLILSLSILVVLHELGHFLPARWFKCRVEKFYLFFDYKFSLLKKKIGETEYGIGWIPFGGYVKISGMIDESMDKEQLKQPPQPYELRSKKPWQRLIIMLGGIIVNVILAIVIFIGIMWHWGEEYIPNNKLTYGIAVDSLAQTIGLKDGDKIVSLDGKPLEDFSDVVGNIVFNEAKTIEITRNGNAQQITIPHSLADNLAKTKAVGFIAPRFPYIIDSVSEAKFVSGNLQKGDRIIAMNNVSTPFFNDFTNAKKDLVNVDITIGILRNEKDTLKTIVHLNEEGKVGIFSKTPNVLLGDSTKKYSFGEAVVVGTKSCFGVLDNQLSAFKQIFTGKIKAKNSLGSFISMGKALPETWNWHKFWLFTGMLSIVLAFFNLLPVPVLDGGYVLFILYEMITGKKVSDKFMERALTVGFILVISLMVYALGLDVWRLFK